MASLKFAPCPGFELEEIPRRSAITTPPEAGPVRFRERTDRTTRVWRARFAKSRLVYPALIRLFREAGRVVPMELSLRGGGTADVFFAEPPRFVHGTAGRASAEVELEERP